MNGDSSHPEHADSARLPHWSPLLHLLFEAEDRIELRFLDPKPGRTSLFVLGPTGVDARESRIIKWNVEQDVYFGLNPRASESRGDDSIEIARALWADFDNCDVESARERLRASGLPREAALVSSGHGVHAYWRLSEPISPQRFRDLQDRLARLLSSDRTVKNPERIARLPGTRHVAKGDGAECRIMEIGGGAVELGHIEAVLPPPLRASDRRSRPQRGLTAPQNGVNGEPRPPIRRASAEVLERGACQGERDNELFGLACDLAAAGTSQPEAERLVLEAAAKCSPSFPATEAIAKVKAAYSKPRGLAPSIQQAARYLAPLGGPSDPTEVREDMAPLGRPLEAIAADISQLTDVGAAARLSLRGALDWRWSESAKTWYTWRDTHWAADDACGIVRLGKETALGIIEEARGSHDDERRSKLLRFATCMQKRDRIGAMIQLAKPDLAVSPDDLDRNDWLLATQAGEIDLRTGKLRPARRSSLCTHVSPVYYDPTATAPRWERFLSEITGGDADFVDFLERFFGMCLTGDVSEQIFPILKGTGRNGKSVLLDTVSWILGDFAIEAPPELIVRRSQRDHPTEIAALRGRRLAVVSETEADEKIKSTLMKRLTGNERLAGRGMYENWTTSRRTAKVLLVTNNMPRIDENTEAVRRRLLVVPFEVVVPESQQDSRLLERLRGEAPGILARLVRGCVSWHQSGLGRPPAVVRATDELVGAVDPFTRWVAERCRISPAGWSAAAAISASLARWGLERRLPVPGSKELAERLRGLGCSQKKSRGLRGWQGISLLDTMDTMDTR